MDSVHPEGSPKSKISRGSLLLCLIYVLVIAAGLITDPFYNMGFNDDWSFSAVAGHYAQSGHVVYVGWSMPALLVQTVYGGLLTRLSGNTFVIHRLGTLFLAGFIPVLLYLTGQRLELSDRMALFGALTVGMSPLFLPHAVSFMTDPYGCFFAVAAIYAGIRSVQTRNGKEAMVWFGVGMLLAFLGGSNRQVAWLAGPAIFIVFLFARPRSPRWLLPAAGAIVGVYGLACLYVMAWLTRQPGFLFVAPMDMLAEMRSGWLHVLVAYAGFALTSLELALPVLATGFRPRRVSPWADALGLSGGALILALGFWKPLFVFPHLSNVLTQYGLFSPDALVLGDLPVVLPMWVRRLIPAVAIGLGLRLATHWVRQAWPANARRLRNVSLPEGAANSQTYSLLIPCAFILLYLLPLAPRAADAYVYDRYVLLILPFVVVLILWAWQRAGVARPGGVAYALLVLFSAYAVLITHDHSALARAQLKAVDALEARGISHDLFAAGFEYDLASQVPNHPIPSAEQLSAATEPMLWYLPMAPALKPAYFVSTSALPAMDACGFGPIPYRTWLAPTHRELLILCGDGHLLPDRVKTSKR